MSALCMRVSCVWLQLADQLLALRSGKMTVQQFATATSADAMAAALGKTALPGKMVSPGDSARPPGNPLHKLHAYATCPAYIGVWMVCVWLTLVQLMTMSSVWMQHCRFRLPTICKHNVHCLGFCCCARLQLSGL